MENVRATPRTNPVRAKVYSSIVVGNMACGGVVRAIDLRRFENDFVSVQSEIQKQWRKRRPLGNGFFKMLAKQVWPRFCSSLVGTSLVRG